MKTGSWAGMFSEPEKVEKAMAEISPLGNLIQEGKKRWDNLLEVFFSLSNQQRCSSKHEMAQWTTRTTWQRVSAQTQTVQSRGNQSLFSMNGLPVQLLCHQLQAQCPDPPPTGEPAEATVATALDPSDPSLQSRSDHDGVYQSFPGTQVSLSSSQ